MITVHTTFVTSSQSVLEFLNQCKGSENLNLLAFLKKITIASVRRLVTLQSCQCHHKTHIQDFAIRCLVFLNFQGFAQHFPRGDSRLLSLFFASCYAAVVSEAVREFKNELEFNNGTSGKPIVAESWLPNCGPSHQFF